MKFIVKVEGIKKKQQLVKTHDFIVSLNAQLSDTDKLLDTAKGVIESNMKTTNKAILMGFDYTQQGSLEILPKFIKEIV